MKFSRKILLVAIAILVCITTGNPVWATPDVKSQVQASDKFKMLKARQKFNEKDYHGALRIYREIYEEEPEDAMLNYRMGECYLALEEADDAIKHFVKAEKLDKEVDDNLYLNLGKSYQLKGDLDKALTHYEVYAAKDLKDYEKDIVNDLIGECKTAKELMANPVPVKIKNLGINVNSKYNDYHPSITADEKVMVFTSRRGEGENSGVDQNDRGYYEDIYITFWDSNLVDWHQSALALGMINGPEHDANLSISPDGEKIFVYKNENGGDIYFSKKSSSERWSKPYPLGGDLNSTYWDSYASLAADGNTMYFCSERKGGFGNGDIWVSERIKGNEWGEPKNLGAVVNSIEDEISVFIHPDGKTLFFSSKGHKNMGGYDIFKTVKNKEGVWSEPENLGYPINSIDDDIDFVLATESPRAYFSSDRPNGFGEFDIYEVNMSKYPVLAGREDATDERERLSILKGTVIDADDATQLSVKIQIRDEVTGELVNEIQSDEEGNYFVTLPGQNNYVVTVKQPEYKGFEMNVYLPIGEKEVYTLVKPIVLEKSGEEEE